MVNRRQGFTLLELLVVMTIMGMLGVASTGGYHAMVRGMTERGAVAAASSVLRAAKERAQVDRKRVIVYYYNRLLKEPNRNADENGLVAGVMIAVRQSGRITDIRDSGALLVDEFGDMELTYETTDNLSDLQRRKGLRLYQLDDVNPSALKYSVVADAAYVHRYRELTVPSLRWTEQTVSQTDDEGNVTEIMAPAFYNLKRSDHEASWKIGDGYGFEFVSIQLPLGFVFGSSIPSQVGEIGGVQTIVFEPQGGGDGTAEVNSTKPNAGGMPQKWKKAGTASSDDKSV